MSIIEPPHDPFAPLLPTPQTPVSEYGHIVIPNIEITGPRLLVFPKPKRALTTAAGLIIPPSAQDQAQEGVVILTGDGIMLDNGTRIASRVRQGQAIIYARYAGVELQMEGLTFIIIQESDVRAVLRYKGQIFEAADDHLFGDDEEGYGIRDFGEDGA